jgi:hypothetical protein
MSVSSLMVVWMLSPTPILELTFFSI